MGIGDAVKMGACLLEELSVLCLVNGWQLCADELHIVLLQNALLQECTMQIRQMEPLYKLAIVEVLHADESPNLQVDLAPHLSKSLGKVESSLAAHGGQDGLRPLLHRCMQRIQALSMSMQII